MTQDSLNLLLAFWLGGVFSTAMTFVLDSFSAKWHWTAVPSTLFWSLFWTSTLLVMLEQQLFEHFERIVSGCSCGCGGDNRDAYEAYSFDLDFGDDYPEPEDFVDGHRCRERFYLRDQWVEKRAA